MKKALLFVALVSIPLSGCVVRGRVGAPVAVAYVEVDEPPPPPPPTRIVVRTSRPGFIWIEGRQTYRGNRYVWEEGRWERERRGHRWSPGRWERRGRKHVWIEGRWHR